MTAKTFHKLGIAEINRETEHAVSIVFAVPEDIKADYAYIQGQHIVLRHQIGGEDLRRNYSICASVRDDELRVAVKEIKGGRFSTFANRELKVGDTLDVFPPAGHFYTELDAGAAKAYVGFAGGSGITPVYSIIKTVLEEEPKSRFTLFYGNRNKSSIIFMEKLAGLKNLYMDRLGIFHVLEEEQNEVEAFNGLLNREKCDLMLDKFVDVSRIDEVFICGPAPMMDAAEASLLAHGVDHAAIHIERFISGPDDVPGEASARANQTAVEGAEVNVTINGVQSSFIFAGDEDSILDAAIDAGADAPYSCKGGACGTCRAKLVEGKVDMAVNYALEQDELEAGYVLTCQSKPQSDRVVLDFDS